MALAFKAFGEFANESLHADELVAVMCLRV